MITENILSNRRTWKVRYYSYFDNVLNYEGVELDIIYDERTQKWEIQSKSIHCGTGISRAVELFNQQPKADPC